MAASTPESQERAVGITAFVAPKVPGFKCTVKQRYTDFLVNEILPNGEVLHLTKESARSKAGKRLRNSEISRIYRAEAISGDPEPFPRDTATPRKKQRIDGEDDGNATPIPEEAAGMTAEVSANSEDASIKDRKEQILADVSGADKTTLQEIFAEETTGRILDLYAKVISRPERKPRDHPLVQSEPISEKSKRTEAHVAIRRIFLSKLETATMQDLPGVISIKAAPRKGPSGARGQPNGENGNSAYHKGKLGWNDLGGEYLHFSLFKENKDTMEVLYFMASQLKIQVKNFEFAGTKDRRGVTVQRVALFRVHADRVAKLNKSARGWRAGNFEYKTYGLDLGQLGGNEFLLTLRDCRFQGDESLVHEQRVQLSKKVVAKATESFSEKGFLNYYGLQRFGSFSTGTHDIGLKMLKGDLEGAIDAILAYSDDLLPENQDMEASTMVPQDDINRADAIRIWRTTGNCNKATSKMPRRFQAEATIIQYLGKKDRKSGKLLQDQDWQGALMGIQRNLRLMYVHAYQSLVWNTVAGKRWELYGDKVVESDLVIVGEKDGDVGPAKDQFDEDGEPIFHPAEDASAPSAEDSYKRARHLTKAEAESGKYEIFDIVLPLPGFDVEYPSNALGKFFEDFMASEGGGGMDPHNMRRSWKDISLSGGYRKIMVRPGKGLEFEVRSHVGEVDQMVETDLEKIRKMAAKEGNVDGDAKDGADAESERLVTPAAVNGEKKIAVILKMQLGSSQYATMALRELTKGGALNYKPDFSTR